MPAQMLRSYCARSGSGHRFVIGSVLSVLPMCNIGLCVVQASACQAPHHPKSTRISTRAVCAACWRPRHTAEDKGARRAGRCPPLVAQPRGARGAQRVEARAALPPALVGDNDRQRLGHRQRRPRGQAVPAAAGGACGHAILLLHARQQGPARLQLLRARARAPSAWACAGMT